MKREVEKGSEDVKERRDREKRGSEKRRGKKRREEKRKEEKKTEEKGICAPGQPSQENRLWVWRSSLPPPRRETTAHCSRLWQSPRRNVAGIPSCPPPLGSPVRCSVHACRVSPHVGLGLAGHMGPGFPFPSGLDPKATKKR